MAIKHSGVLFQVPLLLRSILVEGIPLGSYFCVHPVGDGTILCKVGHQESMTSTRVVHGPAEVYSVTRSVVHGHRQPHRLWAFALGAREPAWAQEQEDCQGVPTPLGGSCGGLRGHAPLGGARREKVLGDRRGGTERGRPFN
jgi:hypothetical protein